MNKIVSSNKCFALAEYNRIVSPCQASPVGTVFIASASGPHPRRAKPPGRDRIDRVRLRIAPTFGPCTPRRIIPEADVIPGWVSPPWVQSEGGRDQYGPYTFGHSVGPGSIVSGGHRERTCSWKSSGESND